MSESKLVLVSRSTALLFGFFLGHFLHGIVLLTINSADPGWAVSAFVVGEMSKRNREEETKDGLGVPPPVKKPAPVFSSDKVGHRKPKEVFESLSYGPCPESQEAVNAWCARHNDKHFGLFINNEWYTPSDRKYSEVKCPGTHEVICHTMEGTSADVDVAVAAAKTAQVSWAALTPHARAKHMYAIARHVQKHARLLAVLESLDNGKSFRETRDSDVPLVARHFYHYAGWAQLMDTEMKGWKPVGVVGEIVPWNFPIMLLAWKVCPALAMGNTVIVKPASYTRLSALLFAEICAEAGLPPGVVNILTGTGAIGSVLCDHPHVDKIAFTGSTAIGRVLRTRVAGSGKKISLELGGKSPFVVFDSADIDSAVEGCVDAIWFNQGQVCSAGSRLLVQASIAPRFIAKLKRRMDHFRIGHPLEKDIDMGALVDKSQYDGIRGFCERAEAEGAEVYKANVEIPPTSTGWYWPPTLITNVSTTSECVRDEIFGPVLSVLTFRSPEEAVALANNTYYGLAASVWTENISLAMEMAISIKAGTVWVNAHNLFDAAAGFGGYRESGYGRDGGREGLYEYVKPAWQTRHVSSLSFPVTAAKWPGENVTACLPSDVKSAAGSTRPFIDRTLKMYIGGKQVRPDGEYSRPVYEGGDASKPLIAEVADGNRKDVRDAVEAAHAAKTGWGARAAHNRAQICYYIAENLSARMTEFAERIARQTGRTVQSGVQEVEASINRLFHYGAYADKFGGEVQETQLYGLTCKIHEPVGVIGIACPDAFPLLAFISLIAPALVRGNCVVIIPSPKHPLSATDLYQVFDTSDLPGGVVNIVTGERDVLVRTLAEHQDVEAVWYHGTEQGSSNVEFAAAQNMKRTWVNFGVDRDWMDMEQGQGMEILLRAVEVKNVWVPMGECKPSGGGY